MVVHKQSKMEKSRKELRHNNLNPFLYGPKHDPAVNKFCAAVQIYAIA